jgi:hypothetical protein
MKNLDAAKLLGCDRGIERYIVDLGSLKTDPSNVEEIEGEEIQS